MSVVSELRQLAVDLEATANGFELPTVSIGLRKAAQAARLRALRAETVVECRTDERPRFARLRAPQRPCKRCSDVMPCLAHLGVTPASGLVCAWCRRTPCENSDGCRAAGLAPALPSEFAAPKPPAIQPPAELMSHKLLRKLPEGCEHYSCDGCGRAGVWHRGLISPPPGKEPRRLCRSCKAKEPC